MRISKSFLLLLVLAVTYACGTPATATAQYNEANISYKDFYEDLALYGQWIDDAQYGYVWSPDEDGSFRPYFSNGYWLMTDFGNTWVSGYPWGWACFHYGRWTYDRYYGWLWIPGPHWGPAWVSWRYNDANFGWAPLGPGYEISTKANDFVCPSDWWVFVPGPYIYAGGYHRYWWGPKDNRALLAKTAVLNNVLNINNSFYVAGPHIQQVQNATKATVEIFKLRTSNSLNTTVQGNTVKMFKPEEIRPLATSGGERVSPPNVVEAPQPIKQSTSVNTSLSIVPEFRRDMPRKSNHSYPVGTRVSETAIPEPAAKPRTVKPYEWDTRQSVAQPPRQPKPEAVPPAPPAKPKQSAPAKQRTTTAAQPVQSQTVTPAAPATPPAKPAARKPE